MDLLLNRQELLDLGEGLQGVRIICRTGRCWLTQAGDNRDHILGPGDGFLVRTRGRLILTAAQPCRLMLTAPKQHNRDKVFFKILLHQS